jgi:NADPH-dependent ferric siderophore reductase
VQKSEWISPHLIRVHVGGDGFAAFTTNDYTDKYVKIAFLTDDGQPVTRTYTVRQVDLEQRVLAIDFVIHGTHGIAAPWAVAAQPGDTITLSGASGAYAPDPAHDWHLFLGDESALPAISSALEALPAQAHGIAYLEAADAIQLNAPAGIDIRWLHRAHPGTEQQLLAGALIEGAWPAGRVGVFAHGERESMKAVRAALKQRDLGGGRLSLSGYWAYGRTEDKFQAEKREPIGKIEA